MSRPLKIAIIAAVLLVLAAMGFGCYRAVVGISGVVGDLQEVTDRLGRRISDANGMARTVFHRQ